MSKLWVKITVVLSLIISVPMIFLGFLLINRSESIVRGAVLNGHKEIIVRTAQEINLMLKQPQEILTSTAALLGIIHAQPWQQETMLVELALNQPIFMQVLSIDLSGKVIANSELGKNLAFYSDKNVIEQIQEGRNYLSELKFQNGQIPYLTMAVPLKVKGKINGALAANVDLRDLWRVVDRIKLNHTGSVFLVSERGMLISHPDKKRVLKNDNLIGQPDVNAALSAKTGSLEFKDDQGKSWISSYSPVSGLGWGVILRQEQYEPYLFFRLMKVQSWLIIILCGIIAVILSMALARLFVKPLQELILKARGAAEGYSDNNVDIKRHDEIGELVKILDNLAFRLKKAKTDERFSSIGEAAAWVAHEIKNSLVSIKLFVQLFPLKHADGKFIDRFNDVVPEEISRCEAVLKRLSDFSLHTELKREKIDIDDLIAKVLGMLENKFIEHKIKVRCEPQEGNLFLWGDFEKLRQVFINLANNSASAMSTGGIFTISTCLVEDNSLYIEIIINDTGTGIPREILKNIFEPFNTTKKDGVGLGLAISRRIIEQHKGEIKIESEFGIGTTVRIKLPQSADKLEEVVR